MRGDFISDHLKDAMGNVLPAPTSLDETIRIARIRADETGQAQIVRYYDNVTGEWRVLPIKPSSYKPGTEDTARKAAGWRNDNAARKQRPIATGVLDYFPDALAEVALASTAGNKQHIPGEPLRWDRTKSTDEANTLIRHFLDRGKIDSDGVRHSAKVAWRALALLQKEIEADQGQET